MQTTQSFILNGEAAHPHESHSIFDAATAYPNGNRPHGWQHTYHDLDDSHHNAEDFHFRESWRHLTRPFGWEWKPDAPDGRMSAVERALLIPITPDLEPGVGKLPLDVCRHFINELGLSLHAIDPERFKSLGFSKTDELLALRDRAENLPREEVVEEFARILEAERILFTLDLIKREGVIPLEGSREAVFALDQKGIKTVIVTNAPERIARAVVEKLGYRTYKEIAVTMPDGTQEPRQVVDRSIVPVIISGNQVRKRKPDPEALELADLHIGWYSLDDKGRGPTRQAVQARRRELAPKGEPLTDGHKRVLLDVFKRSVHEATGVKGLAMYGDSGSDDGAGSAHGVPRVIRTNGHSAVEKFQERGAVVVPRFDDVTPPMLRGEVPFPTINLNGNGVLHEPLGQSVELQFQPNQPSMRERA
ncbi:MAG TPA: HAD family hydrolase [Patescibacteria group bacterium]|nr:HAD family hydrolase [Patescibacteria group bacterium]